MPTPQLIQQWIAWIGESPLRFWLFVLVSIVLLSRTLVGPVANFYARATTEHERKIHHDLLTTIFRQLSKFSISETIIYASGVALRRYYAIFNVTENYSVKHFFRIEPLLYFSWFAAIYVSLFWVFVYTETVDLGIVILATIFTNFVFFKIIIKKKYSYYLVLFGALALINIIFLFTGLTISVGNYRFEYAVLFTTIYPYGFLLCLQVLSVLHSKFSTKQLSIILFALFASIIVSLPAFFYHPYVEYVGPKQVEPDLVEFANIFVNKCLYIDIMRYAFVTFLGVVLFFILVIPFVNIVTDVFSFAITVYLLYVLTKTRKFVSIIFIIFLDIFLGTLFLVICLLSYLFTFALTDSLKYIARGIDLGLDEFVSYYYYQSIGFFLEAIAGLQFTDKAYTFGMLLSATTLLPTIFHLLLTLILLVSKSFEPVVQLIALRLHKLLVQEGEKGRSAAADVIALSVAVLIASVLIWVILS